MADVNIFISSDEGDNWVKYEVAVDHSRPVGFVDWVGRIWCFMISDSDAKIYYSISNDNGETWEDPVLVQVKIDGAGALVDVELEDQVPSAWPDEATGRIYLQYNREDEYKLAYTDDDGVNWIEKSQAIEE